MKQAITFLLILNLIIIFSCSSKIKTSTNTDNKNLAEEPVEVTPESALQSYLHNGDENYKWVIKDTLTIEGVTAYDILLTSQKWREHVWNHQLTIFIPGEIEYKGALLFITGGSVKDDMPNWSSKVDGIIKRFALMAKKNKAITAIIRQTPKQPLYDGLVEDQLISFTLHNFKKDKDYTWPLLFPMVKSAVRSMDAIQEFSQKNLNKEIKRFTIAGASKRGWTTWLTGANDQRVEAIGPMVIDVLNMPVSLDYHIEAWNEYSPQIEDYTKLEIPQQVRTNDGDAITTMVDPYSYRKSLTMPKMIFIGTNDEYWPVDAIKNYIDSIPGENFIHYVPNAGHNLAGGEQALKALSAFWEHTLDKTPYPKLNYNITSNDDSATLTVTASPDELNNVFVWTANSDDRDFRDDKWSSKTIKKGKEIIYDIKYPQSGFKAFYIDLEYKDLNGGKYTKSTRMYVVDEDEVL